VHDHIVAIGEKMEDIKLVNVALNDLPKYWEPLFKGVVIRENLPY
jgi:hypothetical protein